jgi:hypothetical protein
MKSQGSDPDQSKTFVAEFIRSLCRAQLSIDGHDNKIRAYIVGRSAETER